MNRGILILFMCIVVFTVKGFAGNKDTTITTYWRNGMKKSEKVYAYKLYKDKQKRKFIVLNNLRSEKYYANDGREVDESDLFILEYKERRDSTRIAYNREYPDQRPGRKVLFALRNIPFRVDLGDSALYSYQRKDTLIDTTHYDVMIYVKDTMSFLKNKRILLGAFRNTHTAVYYLDLSKHKEETVFDMMQVMQEFGMSMVKVAAVTADVTFKVAETTRKIVKTGTEKATASILGHIIVLMAK